MYQKGKWKVICDRCGFEYLSHEVKKQWDGLIVCDPCFDHDHPQKRVRVRAEDNKLPFRRPEPADIFVTVPYIA